MDDGATCAASGSLRIFCLKIISDMKKLTILFLTLLALTLTGCGQEQLGTNNRLNSLDDAIMKAEYDGHSYIIYKGYRKGGITHDPDCQCHKKGGSEHGED